MKKLNITKKFLEYEYLKLGQSSTEIAKKLKCTFATICNYLKKYNIKKIRNKTKIEYFCIEGCGNKISYKTWLYGNKRCASCHMKYLWKLNIYIPKIGKKNGMFGKHQSLEIKNKQSEMMRINNPMKDLKLRIQTSQRMSGKNHFNYIDGRSFDKYPIEFAQKLRDFIRTRDNFECQNCGMTEEEHLMVNGQVLHVHHIDYNKQNCKEDNLITLCLQCNIRANFNRDYWYSFYQFTFLEIVNKGV